MTITRPQRVELVRMITHLLSREFCVPFLTVADAVSTRDTDKLCSVSTETGAISDPFRDSDSYDTWMRVQDELAAYQKRNGMEFTATWDSINAATHAFYVASAENYHPYHSEES